MALDGHHQKFLQYPDKHPWQFQLTQCVSSGLGFSICQWESPSIFIVVGLKNPFKLAYSLQLFEVGDVYCRLLVCHRKYQPIITSQNKLATIRLTVIGFVTRPIKSKKKNYQLPNCAFPNSLIWGVGWQIIQKNYKVLLHNIIKNVRFCEILVFGATSYVFILNFSKNFSKKNKNKGSHLHYHQNLCIMQHLPNLF